MPQCMNLTSNEIKDSEKKCLRKCVNAIHQTNNQVFQYLLKFEKQQKEIDEKLVSDLHTEVKDEVKK